MLMQPSPTKYQHGRVHYFLEEKSKEPDHILILGVTFSRQYADKSNAQGEIALDYLLLIFLEKCLYLLKLKVSLLALFYVFFEKNK